MYIMVPFYHHPAGVFLTKECIVIILQAANSAMIFMKLTFLMLISVSKYGSVISAHSCRVCVHVHDHRVLSGTMGLF